MTLAQVIQPYLQDLIETLVAVVVGFVGHAMRVYYLAHATTQQKQAVAQDWGTLQAALPVLRELVPPGQPLALAGAVASVADHHGLSITGAALLNSVTKGAFQGLSTAVQPAPAAPAATPIAVPAP